MQKSLYSLFYEDKDKYNEEYESRVKDESTIHLDIDIGEYQGFVCQTTKMLNYIISIERIDKRINALCEKLPGVALEQFAHRCLIDEIVLTNNIEGVYSTRKEIGVILQELSTRNKKERFNGLVKKYSMLIKNMNMELSTCEDIRKIYDDLFFDEIKISDPSNLPDGKVFRKGSTSVYSPTQKELHKGITPEGKIISFMEKALKIVNDQSIDIYIRISVFHYLFGYAHPFYDGNGRTSRFISSYLLSKSLNKLIGYRISYTIKENIKQYYESFKICNHPYSKGDLTPFVENFLAIIESSVAQLEIALKKRVEQLEVYMANIVYLPNANGKNIHQLYFLLIQAALFSNLGISIEEIEEVLEVSHNTAMSRLKRIPDGLIITNLQKRKKYFLLNLEAANKYFE